MRIGVCGFLEHKWQSVERTRKFYEAALQREFEIVPLDHLAEAWPEIDAVLDFTGAQCWALERHPGVPMFFALHGGVVLDQPFLRENLKKLTTSDGLIVNCTSDIAILDEMFLGERPIISHLPLPVRSGNFTPLNKSFCRAELEIQGADYIVGFVGRFLPQKNLHQFLRMLAKLRATMPGVNIVGLAVGKFWVDYPVLNYSNAHYEQYIADTIQQLGLGDSLIYFPNLNDAELQLCYGAMDLLFHPTNSIDENFGYTPIEAMACGTAVVGASYGGLKDTLECRSGAPFATWVTESGIRMDLVKAYHSLRELLIDHDAREKLNHAARKRIQEFYSFDRCADALCDPIKAAIRQTKNVRPRPLQLARPPAPQLSGNWLPQIANGWEQYADVAARYVSSSPPTVSSRSLLCLAAPLRQLDEGRYMLDDPAWPAVFPLMPEEHAALSRCMNEVPASEICSFGISLDRLQEWVAAGLLIACNHLVNGKR
ncbi:MAG TPA: glycosyltransferase family 4 protein [Candidatus Angelobacter sp.]|nr:glycosyltransferase family 4 protein [Candidatus Angelobacter sp.]